MARRRRGVRDGAVRRRLLASAPAALALAVGIAASGDATTLAGQSFASPRSAGDARILGTFSMTAHVLTAVNVRGEHRGQILHRMWRVTPYDCHGGSRCDTLVLHRQRSAGNVERVILRRVGPGRYAGHGAFFVGLRCSGQVYRHGSRAPFRLTITVTAATTVESLRFAQALRASYDNPRRSDATPCPLGPSHDAARYTGRLSSPVPSPPSAVFSVSTPISESVSFAGSATPGDLHAPVTHYAWSFGDPGSGAMDSSARRNPTHTFSAPGEYTVTLTVRDIDGLSGTVSHTIVVPPTTPLPLEP